MKAKRSLSFILIAAVIFSLIQSFPLLSSAEVNGTGCVEADWEDYLKTKLPMDSSLRTYGEHVKIYAVDNKPLPENERFYVYKIHTSIGNSASFVPQRLEMLIEDSYRSVMSEEIDVTILEGYETAAEKYRGIGDGQAVSGDYLLQIQRGVDSCEVAVEIVVHKNLSLTTAGEAKWNSFLENPRWYNDADYSRYLWLNRTLITEENGVPLPEDQQYYTYRLSISFSSVELFTKEQLSTRLNWCLRDVSASGLIVDGYEEAYAKLSQMENGGSSTDTYKILINNEYVAEIEITVSVGTNFASGNFVWESLLGKMSTDSTQSIYAEHAIITSDNGQVLEEPITVHKLHVTLGSAQSLTAQNLEKIISNLFCQYTVQIAPPPTRMISGVEEALQKYQQIGDGQAVTNTFRFIHYSQARSYTPSTHQNPTFGIEAEIVIHKDLSIDEAAKNTLSANWKNYVEVSLPEVTNSVRTYGEKAWIESVNNQLLPEEDRFFIYKIHTSFGRSASFTKENLETLLEESYHETMNSKVDIQILDGFESAKEKFSPEGDHGTATQLFTLQIQANGTGITESVEIVIHKDIGLELRLPGDLDIFSNCAEPIALTCREAPGFNPELVAEIIEDEYWDWMEDRVTVTVDDFSNALVEYRKLADGATMTCSIPVTVQRNNNSYSTEIRFAVTKDLSLCTGYDHGVCPVCGAKLGDVNDDGVVDDNDVVLLKQYIVDLIDETEADISLADMNQDGRINTGDVLLIKRLIAGVLVWD